VSCGSLVVYQNNIVTEKLLLWR